jgi:hypothetical protein
MQRKNVGPQSEQQSRRKESTRLEIFATCVTRTKHFPLLLFAPVPNNFCDPNEADFEWPSAQFAIEMNARAQCVCVCVSQQQPPAETNGLGALSDDL